ncbi:MAG TPA: carbon-nitrogen hydrolase family protein [Pseudonocardiaceae bacterium]|nr:carbon-nitrogen hydrolase family protein [Pseudonocardiaceae bacterium]
MTTVAVAQFSAGLDKEANRKLTVEAIDAAAEAGADLVITPEYSMYWDAKSVGTDPSYPEGLDGPFVTAVRETARAKRVAVVAGMTETVDDDKRPSNTLVAVDSAGELLGVYRKVHLYDAFGFRESDTIRPAPITTPLTFTVGDLIFGTMTCYDLRFPEMARTLVDAGANALVLPAAWVVGPAKEDQWTTLVRARAIENTVYVCAAGQTGPYCAGQSLIADPMGVVVAGAGESPGLAMATLSTDRIEAVRTKNPSLTNRRFKVMPA